MLLTNLHAQKGEVVSLQVVGELSESGNHQLLNGQPLVPGDPGGESEPVNGTSHTDPGGLDWGIGVDVALDLGHVHVGLVGKVSLEAVVLKDDWLEDILEVLVGVSISGVDTAVLVVEVDGASDSLERKKKKIYLKKI